MELETLAQVVDDMIIQHDYPGFEPRALKLGLPESILQYPSKIFANALGHDNIYVKLASLRWFQERPGLARSYLKAIVGLLEHQDEFVRMETARTIERIQTSVPADIVVRITELLKDPNPEVRKAGAKAIGKLSKKAKDRDPVVLERLKEAASDKDPEVRMKVQKAVRLIEG